MCVWAWRRSPSLTGFSQFSPPIRPHCFLAPSQHLTCFTVWLQLDHTSVLTVDWSKFQKMNETALSILRFSWSPMHLILFFFLPHRSDFYPDLSLLRNDSCHLAFGVGLGCSRLCIPNLCRIVQVGEKTRRAVTNSYNSALELYCIY